MSPIRFATVAGVILLFAAPPAAAQSVPARESPGHLVSWAPPPAALARLTPTSPAAGPLFESASPSALATVAKVGQGGRREAVALMVVGAAGIVTGLIADEDILIIAGAGVGGFGLYLYLR